MVHKKATRASTLAYRNIYGGLNSSFPAGQPGLPDHRNTEIAGWQIWLLGGSVLEKSQHSLLRGEVEHLPEGVPTQPCPQSLLHPQAGRDDLPQLFRSPYSYSGSLSWVILTTGGQGLWYGSCSALSELGRRWAGRLG